MISVFLFYFIFSRAFISQCNSYWNNSPEEKRAFQNTGLSLHDEDANNLMLHAEKKTKNRALLFLSAPKMEP